MQRIIAYIYRYKENKGSENTKGEDIFTRCGNAGFCRVEICDDRCTATICFKDICMMSGKCVIYGLVENRSLQDKQNCYEIKENERNQSVTEGRMNAKVDVSGTDGILIECGDCKYAALWRETADRLCFQHHENREVEEEISQEELIEEVEKEVKEEVKEEVEEEVEEEVKEEVEEVKEEVKEEANEEQDRADKRIDRNGAVNAVMLERAYNRLCKVRMTINGKTYQVVKMRPQEMIMLPRNYWRLANNLFLMDGYYTYKHIIFFKYEGGYALGVPGKTNMTESAYAVKFGFNEPVTGNDYGKNTDSRTYWLMRLL